MNVHWIRTAWIAALLSASARAQTTELESRASVPGNSYSDESCISADGRFVAFVSDSSDLVAGDTNGVWDIFVYEVATGTIERVSVSTGGAQANSLCESPSISSDGRFVAFDSSASNLVAGDTNGATDVFVHDRQTGTTEIVSLATGGALGNGVSYSPSISADGRYVAFWSSASNLVAGDTNGVYDIFVHDRQTGTTERASVATGGTQANGSSYNPAISADGRYVVFSSDATNLVAGDTNGLRDVFVRDRQAGTTVRASVGVGGVNSNGSSYSPVSISSDGRYVCFESGATNLVAGDTNGMSDVFVRDLQAGTTEIASLGAGSVQGNGNSFSSSITSDGRFVVFASTATNLVAGDTNGVRDDFVRDRQLGTTVRASIATGGGQGDQDAGGLPTISLDGSRVAFSSAATNLAVNDGNGDSDVFLRDFPAGTTTIVSAFLETANTASEAPVVSADGNLVVFQGAAANPVLEGPNAVSDIFLRNRSAGTIEWISVSTTGGNADEPSYVPAMTPDGRYVAFASLASNLVAGVHGDYNVFLRDRQIGTTELVSVATNGTQGDNDSGFARPAYGGVPMGISISPDGRYVAFGSLADNLDPAHGVSGAGEVFVRDRLAGTTEIVSVTSTGGVDNDSTYAPSISADGRYVVYHSFATNIVPGDTNGFTDVFMRDRTTGTTTRLSEASGGGDANGDSSFPVISADGRFVAFPSGATNLVPGGSSIQGEVFVRNLATGSMETASVSSAGVEGDGGIAGISSDGRFVIFGSGAALVPGDTNGFVDVYLRDRATRTTSLVSLSTDGQQSNGMSGVPFNFDQEVNLALSPDGRYVAFATLATNFGYTDGNSVPDIFLRDRGPAASFAAFCFGDGTGAACPCANSGAPGHGCENSSTTGGALLSGTGTADLSADSVVFTSSGEKPTATSVLLSGSAIVNSLHYGDGLRCVGGTLKRLYTHNAVGGVVTMPQGADPSISARSAANGDVIQVGSTRVYQVYYRDPSTTFCPTPMGSTFNISNAIAIAWGS